MKLELLVLLAVAAVCVFAKDSRKESEGLPSILGLGLLGAKFDLSEASEDSEDQDSTPPPAPCCFPDVWQGVVIGDYGIATIRGREGRGKPTVSRSKSEVFIDGPNKRVANNMVVGNGSGKYLKISYIYQVGVNNTGDLYYFDRTAKKCHHRTIPGAHWKRQCIPVNATAGSQYSLGPGTGGLAVQSWLLEGGSERVDSLMSGPAGRRPKLRLAANLVVIPGACVPVVIQEEGSILIGDTQESNIFDMSSKPKPPKWYGKAFAGSSYFTDLQAKISDPAVFNVPSYCQNATSNLFFDDMEDVHPAMLERFLVL